MSQNTWVVWFKYKTCYSTRIQYRDRFFAICSFILSKYIEKAISS